VRLSRRRCAGRGPGVRARSGAARRGPRSKRRARQQPGAERAGGPGAELRRAGAQRRGPVWLVAARARV
jgi:hypothetical protein